MIHELKCAPICGDGMYSCAAAYVCKNVSDDVFLIMQKKSNVWYLDHLRSH